MTVPSSSPNTFIPARLILAIVLSAAVHTLLLLGLGRYHPGVCIGHFLTESSTPGALRVRIISLAPGEAFIPRETPASLAQEAPAVLSTPTTASESSPPTPPSTDKAVAHGAPRLHETYYRTGDLDVRPQIKVRVMPVYPEIAVLQNLGGRVIIRVFISEAGNVDEVEVVQAKPPEIFDDSAITAFRAAQFTPGMKGHKAVKSLMTLEVSYDSTEAQDAPTGTR